MEMYRATTAFAASAAYFYIINKVFIHGREVVLFSFFRRFFDWFFSSHFFLSRGFFYWFSFFSYSFLFRSSFFLNNRFLCRGCFFSRLSNRFFCYNSFLNRRCCFRGFNVVVF